MLSLRFLGSVSFLCLALLSSVPNAVYAADFVAGVNVVNPMRYSDADRDAVVAQLKTANVHVVRFGLAPNEKDIDFAKKLYDQGIKINLIVDPQYPANAPSRPFQPQAYPSMWGGHPLSYADPTLSQTYMQTLMSMLEAQGIVLESLELGNEINWAAFNAEFPLPGEGKIMGLKDLYTDPEGQQIAKGYLQYLKILAVLKEVRDHSDLNRHTPILSAGLSNTGVARLTPNSKTDGVSIHATLDFLRAHGLDNLVDGYGVHFYPWQNLATSRHGDLDDNVVLDCKPTNSGSGKPCWITEWGITNKNTSCPLDETSRSPLVQEVMGYYRQLAAQGRLGGALWFEWTSDPWAKSVDPDGIYRCGALTEAGRIALTP